jgi:ribonuclease HI
MLKTVIITVAASSRGNEQATEKRAATAAILSYEDYLRAVAAYLGNLSNQQAEICAAALGLEALKEPCEVLLQTNSLYVAESMSGGFKRKTNHEFWERLDQAAGRHKVTWIWISGHNGRREHQAANHLAQAVANIGEVTPLILDETINRLRGQITPALVAAVHDGLRYLAGACDGARMRDSEGFSKFDADFGHRLAAKASLNPREVALGRGLLRRYRRQLSEYDPAISAII